jgi:hypothetical protein
MKKTSNPDNSVDNLEKLKTKINKTEHNTEVAEDLISSTTDVRLKETLEEKNERRRNAINVIKREMKQD